jgi:hypothetical protein
MEGGRIMSLLNGFKGNIVTGLAIGIGATVLAPAIIPVFASIAKPLAKAAVKGGIMLYDKGREAYAETREVVEDLVAEARSEMTQAEGEQPEIAEEVPQDIPPQT